MGQTDGKRQVRCSYHLAVIASVSQLRELIKGNIAKSGAYKHPTKTTGKAF